MFCYQCEQAAKGTGCDKIGICGKQPDVAALQDLTAYALRGLALICAKAREKGLRDHRADEYIPAALFSTLTNVNFDPEDFENMIRETCRLRDTLKARVYKEKGGMDLPQGPATWIPASDQGGLLLQAQDLGLLNYPSEDPDIRSLMHTILFGLKGVAAYADHARILGVEDDALYDFFHYSLAAGWDGVERDLSDWLGLALKVGEFNYKAMEMLDRANTGAYGHPEPTAVPLGHKAGKCILISGHDLKDLEMLLAQTEGAGINIYTHGEMIPCHGYPELKKRYPHLHGNFGTAWQNQQREFPAFPGAVLMTTNCLQKPQKVYTDNIFTTGLVGWPGVPHIEADTKGWKDFSPVIERAKELPGFEADEDKGSVLVGFARNTLLNAAGKVVAAVKSGAIRHFFLVGGCDGAKPGRNYYTEFVEKVPQDCIVLTLACGKYRFYDKKLGEIGGLPRLMDVGQCNDAYSAIQVALALAEAFDTDVNGLPLTLILSWYEQKAVAILLTLLALGVKNIRLGPSLPAFLTPNVINYLVENYGLKPITTPEQDLEDILATAAV